MRLTETLLQDTDLAHMTVLQKENVDVRVQDQSAVEDNHIRHEGAAD